MPICVLFISNLVDEFPWSSILTLIWVLVNLSDVKNIVEQQEIISVQNNSTIFTILPTKS